MSIDGNLLIETSDLTNIFSPTHETRPEYLKEKDW